MTRVKMAVALVMTVSTASATGCAIHTQAPIKEVAYDFSDADFYDRAYAPSPDYGPRKAVWAPAQAVIGVRVLPAGEPIDVGALPAGDAIDMAAASAMR